MISRTVAAGLTVVVVLAIVVAACGDDDAGGGTTQAVVFGEGEIPSSMPDDFPVPDGAVIGTTLVDKVNHRSEFRLTVQADIQVTIQFFEVGLVNSGYIVDVSEGNAAEWTIEFSREELKGTVFITPQGPASTAVVSVNRA